MINFTLQGRIPSKKNSKQILFVKGRRIIASSKQYADWNKDNLLLLRLLKVPKQENVEKVVITIFAPDKRKSDLTNKAESIMDLMVDGGILNDDNWFEVPCIELRFGGVDAKKARAEIEIITNYGNTRNTSSTEANG